ncbi:hypothetical protein BR63_10985 [Thermanaerosceptrum fracticalcis]|uniref:Uncharacterized protein n=1 Tax=Thermanaerosceptrum fracticalcis TaxID=1712410 RepID=A0A7G6E3Y2_THEFR|nr:hypothetical protein [Thermanaerosceptrum fracticalcis]QNB46786.1 hypothetical protein BR63_10985 [Thermanaerosceptrum fracticalcis]
MLGYRVGIWGFIESFMLILIMAIPLMFLIGVIIYWIEWLKQGQSVDKRTLPSLEKRKYNETQDDAGFDRKRLVDDKIPLSIDKASKDFNGL